MKSSRQPWIAVTVAAILGIAAGAGGTWLAVRGPGNTLDAKVRQLRSQLADSNQEIADLSAALNEERSAATTAPPAVAEPTSTVKPGSQSKPVRQYAYIRSIKTGAGATLVADYAQYLTGKAAAAAAKAAGDESPPPNDYYVVNSNPKLRTLPISPTVKVTLTTKPGDNPVADGYPSTLTALAGYLSTDTEYTASLKADGFWLTLTNGEITTIVEQYQP